MPEGSAKVLFFAQAREAAGTRSLEFALPAAGVPMKVVLAELVREHPGLVPVLKHSRLVLNGEYVKAASIRIRPGDELAVHPPYSGG